MLLATKTPLRRGCRFASRDLDLRLKRPSDGATAKRQGGGEEAKLAG